VTHCLNIELLGDEPDKVRFWNQWAGHARDKFLETKYFDWGWRVLIFQGKISKRGSSVQGSRVMKL